MVDTHAGWLKTEFDGESDYLARVVAPTGVADGKVGSVSFWMLLTGRDDAHRYILHTSGSAFVVYIHANNMLTIAAKNTGTNIILALNSSPTSLVETGSWIHIAASWDLGNDNKHLYVNNVSSLTEATFTDDVIDYTVAKYNIGSALGPVFHFEGDTSELYVNTAEYIDLSVKANRQKFISAEGRQVFLGEDGSIPTGTAPLIYIKPTWSAAGVLSAGNNAGSGGDFTAAGDPVVTGAISIADTVGTPAEGDRSGFYPTDERWYQCDRDGWWYPKSETRFEEHSGLRVSLDDYNEDDSQERDMLHQSIFAREEEQTE